MPYYYHNLTESVKIRVGVKYARRDIFARRVTFHEDTFARVEFFYFFFSTSVSPNLYPWSVTFFFFFFFLLFFLTTNVTPNPYPWSVSLFSYFYFYLLKFYFYFLFFYYHCYPLTLTLDNFF